MNWRAISRYTGFALLVSALFMLLSVFVSMLEGNDSALAALAISFTITFICGFFPLIFVRNTAKISLKEGYVIIALSWFLSFIFGMLPYALWGGPIDLDTAWFESVSGYTTTGSTALSNVEALPKSLLFWRSSTHFIGGLGVVVFLLLIIPGSSPMKLRLSNMELSSLSKGAYSARANRTAYIFACVYLGLFILAAVSYKLAGMSFFDALCHAMSVCASGGFSTRNMSIAAFDSRLIEGMTMVFMYLSSIHYGLIYLAAVTKSLKPFNNSIIKFYTLVVLAVSLTVGITLKTSGMCDSFGDALWNGLFQTLCISSTTGFAIIDNAQWPMYINMILMLTAIMCGCAGSTSGGIKADRILIFLKTCAVYAKRSLHPSTVCEVRIGNRVMRDEDIHQHTLYIGMYGLLLAVSSLLTMALGVNDMNAFAASVASLGNVGPAVGALGTMGSYACVGGAAKLVYTFDMFLGRVEIYPLLAVIAMMCDRFRK